MIQRRHFLKSTFSAGILGTLPFRFDLPNGEFSATKAEAQTLDAGHPIQPLPSNAMSSRDFNGDSITRPHDILWDIEGYMRKKGGWPEPSEQIDVAVVGGGVAGLTAAYFLRAQKTVLLEQAENFGGNSRGEQLGGSRYSIGAAYIPMPEAGSVTARLLNELKLASQARAENPDEMLVLNESRLSKGFWSGETAPEAKVQFQAVHRTLSGLRGRVGNNPTLDRMTFAQWLKTQFGTLHPHILEYFQLYAWSSFAVSIEEISALQMLDFVSSDTGPLLAFPGGNAAITGRLYEALRASLPATSLRRNCMVVDLRLDRDGVRVTFIDGNNQPRALFAKRVVYAAPKFVAQHTVRDLSPEQKRAMEAIRYRAYVVANIFIKKPFKAPTFDLYCLQNEVPEASSAMHPSKRGFTDICFGTWAQNDRTNLPVITAYKAYAYDGARQTLMNPSAHERVGTQIISSLQPLFDALNLKPNDIGGMRLTRWGHSLPVAAPGLIASGVAELASSPVGGRIFFANQDNWANPCFETAAESAYEAARAILGAKFR